MSFSSKQHQQPVFLEAFPPEGSSWLFVLVGFFNSYFFMHRLGSSVSHKKAVVVNTRGLVLVSPVCAERPSCFSSLCSPGGSGGSAFACLFFLAQLFLHSYRGKISQHSVFVLLLYKNGERTSSICGCSTRCELPQPSGVSWTDHGTPSFILPALFSMAETPALCISSAAPDGKPMRL